MSLTSLGVVLGQRLVPVVADELHHRAEGQRVREAVLPVAVVDLDQLVVSPFPGGPGEEETGQKQLKRTREPPVLLTRSMLLSGTVR